MACHFSEPLNDPEIAQKLIERCQTGNPGSPTCRQPPDEPCKENPILQPSVDHSDGCFKHTMHSSAQAIQEISSSADHDQRMNTEFLEERARHISTWKTTIEALISRLREEIKVLEDEKRRLKRALTALIVPENIVIECTSRRTSRTGNDLILDTVDRALLEEERLCRDVRDVLTLILNEVESQLESDKICKIQLEFDWSDKSDSYRLEVINVGLRNHGPVSFYPGATRLQANQATPEHWLHYTKELVNQAHIVLERSAALRKKLEEEIAKAVADLRAQADKVELSLQQNIANAEQSLQEAETDLSKVLNQITIAETVHGKLANLARQVDFSLKTSQTRLDNRSQRLRAENTRDPTQYGLLDEVKHLNEHADRIKKKMDDADATLQVIYKSRALLEDKIAVKRKSIYIDRVRCLSARCEFPDASTLSGFTP